jgi:repressor LexA
MKDRTKLSERQKGILKFMEAYLDMHGFPPTIREIGEATGINSTSVVNYNLNKLVTMGYLARVGHKSRGMRLVKVENGSKSLRLVPPSMPMIGIPLYATPIVASAPMPIPEEVAVEDTLEIPAWMGNIDPSEVYALRVKGDSMIDAMIRDGDIVLFRKQNTAQNGDMVAVWLDEQNATTLKHFYNEGSRIRLQPAHPMMDAIYVDADHCHVQGKVLSVIRQMD